MASPAVRDPLPPPATRPRGVSALRAAECDRQWIDDLMQDTGAASVSYARLVEVDGQLWWTDGGVVGTELDCAQHVAGLDRPVDAAEAEALRQPTNQQLRNFVVRAPSATVGPGYKASLLVWMQGTLHGVLRLRFPPGPSRRDVRTALAGRIEDIRAQVVDGDAAMTLDTAPRHVMVDTRTPPAGAGPRLPWLDDDRTRRLWRRLRESDNTTWTLDGAVIRRVDTLFAPRGVFVVALSPAARPALYAGALLSPAQRVVAEYFAHGATVGEISRSIDRSSETVRSHLRATYARLQVASRIDLARALGIFSDETGAADPLVHG